MPESFADGSVSDSEAETMAENDPGLVLNEGNVCWFEIKVPEYLLEEKIYSLKDVFLRVKILQLSDINVFLTYGESKKLQTEALSYKDTVPFQIIDED